MTKSRLEKRSMRLVTGSGPIRTSLALEPEFWAAIEARAKAQAMSLPALIAQIRDKDGERALASAVRVRCLTPAAAEGAPS